jgi:D-alanyl-D-alanine carboxypeptidase
MLILRTKTFAAVLFVAVLVGGAVFAQTNRSSYTTTADVPLRSGPGANYSVIATLPKGIRVNVVGKEGYWLKVESKHGAQPGYIDEQFATSDAAPKNRRTKASAASVAGRYRTLKEISLRQGPGAKYPMVARIPADIIVHVTGAEGEWLRVESNRGGKPGYVEKRDVEPWTER